MRPRDTQRQRVYDAERASRVRGREFASVDEIQRYVDALTKRAWFISRWGHKRIKVTDGRSRRRGGSTWTQIKMPTWTRYEMYVLHEVAHTVMPVGLAPHGPEYAGVLVTMVRLAMGTVAAAMLRDAMRERRVRVRMTNAKPNRERFERVKAERMREQAAGSTTGGEL